MTFFSKKIYSTKKNKIIETRYVVFEGITYRAKYSQNKKYQSRGKNQKWTCCKEGCKGEMQTSNRQIDAIITLHNDNCNANRTVTNVRKENSLQRMKQAVANSDTPRDAYESEVLFGAPEDYWGYQEVAKRLYDVRRQKGTPKLPDRKEDICKFITDTKYELNHYGAQLYGNTNNTNNKNKSAKSLDTEIANALQQISTLKTSLHCLQQRKLALNTDFAKLADKLYFGSDKKGTFQVFTDKKALEILLTAD